MKTSNNSLAFVRHLVLYSVVIFGVSAKAQEEQVVNVNAQDAKIVNVNNDSKPLIVDGEGVSEEVTDSELEYLDSELKKQGQQIQLNSKKTQKYKKLQNTTEKLSVATEKYVDEKKTSEKTIKEYNQKIKCMLDESGTDPECDEYRKEDKSNETKAAVVVDSAQTQQSATQPQVVIQNIMPENNKEAASSEPIPLSLDQIESADQAPQLNASDKMKVYPYLGIGSFEGDQISGIQTNSLFGIRFESNPLAGRLLIGAGLSYKDLTTKDGGTELYTIDPFYAAEIEYSNTTIDLYGKVLLIKNNNFMPYLMGGFGYNMMNLQNSNVSGAYSYNGQNSSTSVSRNFLTGTFGGGLDYAFNSIVGANLELNYSTGLTSFGDEQESNDPYNFGATRMEDLATDFTEASTFVIQAGLIIFF